MVPFLFSSGCGKPNAANIELRKQNQQLHAQIDDLNRRHNADVATIDGLKSGATTVPTLPADRLSQLFTVHGLKFGRLTRGEDLDPNKPGDETIKVSVVPTDDQGQPIKAAGAFEIEAFDLASPGDTRVGRWTFDIDQSRKSWFGDALQYNYIFVCPLPAAPKHPDLTIRVTFTDALTGRKFVEQRQVKIKLP